MYFSGFCGRNRPEYVFPEGRCFFISLINIVMVVDPRLQKGLSRRSLTATTRGPQVTLADSDRRILRSPQAAINNFTDKGSIGTLAYPGDILSAQYLFVIFIMKFVRQSWSKIAKLDPEYVLYLPLPSPLVDQQNVTLEQQPLNALGYAALNLPGFATAVTQGEIMKSLAAAKDTLVAGSVRAGADIAKGLVGNDIVAGAAAGAGIALNEFLTVMLKGPAYKKPQLVWRFSPNNEQESENLQHIMAVIKNAQAPSVGALGDAYFNYPRVFQCHIITATPGRSKEEMAGRIYGFKPALLESSNFNYTPADVPSFYGKTDQPEGVTMALQFQELEFWLNSSEDAWDAYRGMPAKSTGDGGGGGGGGGF